MNPTILKLAHLAFHPNSNNAVQVRRGTLDLIDVKVDSSTTQEGLNWYGPVKDWEEALREVLKCGVTSEEGTITQEIFEDEWDVQEASNRV